MKPVILDKAFYIGSDVKSIARQLLGKCLFTSIHHQVSGGLIVETEAYAGISDRASHAWAGRRTRRTQVMYSEGGVAYVYLCYGIHSLFNIITNIRDVPDAVLIRGIRPTHGIHFMEERLNKELNQNMHLNGPGLVSKALGITTAYTGKTLQKELDGSSIWLEDHGIEVSNKDIHQTPRIGVAYAGPDASLPYRFIWKIKKAESNE